MEDPAGEVPLPARAGGARNGEPPPVTDALPLSCLSPFAGTPGPFNAITDQLKRVARTVSLSIGRMGGLGGDSSGDIFLAFSTANPGLEGAQEPMPALLLPNPRIDALFEATVQATEEAIVNSLVAAETMVGLDFLRVEALPHDRLREILARYG
jgi:hypothetical protein